MLKDTLINKHLRPCFKV